VGKLLRKICRRVDVVSRYGGEEFVVLLPEIQLFDALTFAEKVRSSIAALDIASGDNTLNVTASVGVAAYPQALFADGTDLVAAADRAGVRRVVQESVSFLYADAGQDWVTESSPVEITVATEPAAVAESRVQDYARESRAGVVLRFGLVTGSDPLTAFHLRAAAHGRPVVMGRPEGWAHLVHPDDVGSAVVAALHAPTGVYNVGADPVRRSDLAAVFAVAAGVPSVNFYGPLLRRLAGPRAEPLSRSLRICSEHFAAQTGWRPSRPVVTPEWLRPPVLEAAR